MIPFQQLRQSDLPLPASTVAVLPLGALETHGPHLPLGTDSLIAEALLDRTAGLRGETAPPAVRLPVLWLGASDEHASRAGTLSWPAEALAGQITAIGHGLAAAGIGRLVLLNAHGGNRATAEIAALRLRGDAGMLVVTPHWSQFGLPDDLPDHLPRHGDIHGGWQETALMLAGYPELVNREAIADFPIDTALTGRLGQLFPVGRIGWGWHTGDLSSSGALGRADLATPALGEQLLDHLAAALAALIAEVSALPWPDQR